MSDATASFETPADAGEGEAGAVRLWLEAITLARKEEEAWRRKADAAVLRYRDEESRKGRRFNILFANVSTVLPAIYNSTPVPDVRRRFGDADEVGKIAAQAIERSVSYLADTYDFDGTMRAVCFDMELTGRGVPRVRYDATTQQDDAGEYADIVDQRASCEHVDWRDFTRGPGRKWSDVPWIAFDHRLTREELTERFGDIGKTMPLDIVQDGARRDDDRDVPDVFKRGTVHEVWDKQGREVLFIAPTVPGRVLKREADPMGLQGFFCVPRPAYSIADAGSLVPLVPFEIYKDQAEELDRVTARITALVNVLRYRGLRDASITEFASMAEAKDGDFVPVENAQQFTSATGGGGLERAFFVMPIEQVVAVVRELVVHREQIKQVIYEITGLADIMRGASMASETATAQQIKAQWGSLRIQDRQAEVQRVARDLIRMKAELVAEKFEATTLAMMTGLDLPPAEVKAQAAALMQQAQAMQQEPPPGVAEAAQSPTWDDVLAVLRSDAMRSYRIDIETDSTIQADATRAQQNAGAFVQGFAGFVQAIGPAVQAGVMPLDVATDLLTAFARTFKLGRQAEDALDRLGQVAQQPQPQDDGAGAAEAQAAQAAQAEAAQAQAEAAQTMQLEQARMQMDAQVKMAQIQSVGDIKRMEIEAEDRREAAKLQMQWQIAQLNASIKAAPASPQVAPVALSLGEGAEQAITTAFGPIAQMMQMQAGQADAMTQSAAQMAEAARMMSAPVEIVRGPDGRAVGTRRVQA